MRDITIPEDVLIKTEELYDHGIKAKEIVSMLNLESHGVKYSNIHMIVRPININDSKCKVCGGTNLVYKKRRREPFGSTNNPIYCLDCKHKEYNSEAWNNTCDCNKCREKKRLEVQQRRAAWQKQITLKKRQKEEVERIKNEQKTKISDEIELQGKLTVAMTLSATEIEYLIEIIKESSKRQYFERYIDRLEYWYSQARLLGRNNALQGNYGKCKYCNKMIYWINRKTHNINDDGSISGGLHKCVEYQILKKQDDINID